MDPRFKKCWIPSSGKSESAVLACVKNELVYRYNKRLESGAVNTATSAPSARPAENVSGSGSTLGSSQSIEAMRGVQYTSFLLKEIIL